VELDDLIRDLPEGVVVQRRFVEGIGTSTVILVGSDHPDRSEALGQIMEFAERHGASGGQPSPDRLALTGPRQSAPVRLVSLPGRYIDAWRNSAISPWPGGLPLDIDDVTALLNCPAGVTGLSIIETGPLFGRLTTDWINITNFAEFSTSIGEFCGSQFCQGLHVSDPSESNIAVRRKHATWDTFVLYISSWCSST
jgi:hypothetical protein